MKESFPKNILQEISLSQYEDVNLQANSSLHPPRVPSAWLTAKKGKALAKSLQILLLGDESSPSCRTERRRKLALPTPLRRSGHGGSGLSQNGKLFSVGAAESFPKSTFRTFPLLPPLHAERRRKGACAKAEICRPRARRQPHNIIIKQTDKPITLRGASPHAPTHSPLP